MEIRAWVVGCSVYGVAFRVVGLGLGVRAGVRGLGYKVWGIGFRVWGLGYRV